MSDQTLLYKERRGCRTDSCAAPPFLGVPEEIDMLMRNIVMQMLQFFQPVVDLFGFAAVKQIKAKPNCHEYDAGEQKLQNCIQNVAAVIWNPVKR